MESSRVFIITLLVCSVLLPSCKKPVADPSITVSQKSLTMSWEETSDEIGIESNCVWAASANTDWIHISPESGEGNCCLTISVNANIAATGERASSRTGCVSIAAQGISRVINVTQLAEAEILLAEGDNTRIPASGGTVSIRLQHNVIYSIRVEGGNGWVLPVTTKSAATSDYVYSIQENKDGERTASIIFKSVDGTETNISITQDAFVYQPSFAGEGTEGNPYLIGSPEELRELSKISNDASLSERFSTGIYNLTADISMDGAAFTPLFQSTDIPFKGILDGKGHRIDRLNIDSRVRKASGLVACCSGARIQDIALENLKLRSAYVRCGAVAGYAVSSTIEGCSISGTIMQNTANLNVDGIDNSGFSGGVAGYLNESVVKGCTVDADMTFYGKFSGGIAGWVENSTIESCHVLKDRTLSIYYHFAGGIAGRMKGARSLVKGCSFEANFSQTGCVMGGIVGQVHGGKIEGCVLGSHATLGSDKHYVGGIVGAAQPENEIVIENCASYGTISGQYCVGGIIGYSGPGGDLTNNNFKTATDKPVTISNCAFIRGKVTATGGNSFNYPIAGGIVGWSQGTNSITLKDCFSRPGTIQTTHGANVNAVLSGICAYQNTMGGASIRNCYTSFAVSDLIVCGEQADTDENRWYAGIAIRCTEPTEVTNCYSTDGLRVEYSCPGAIISSCGNLSSLAMTDGTLLMRLKFGGGNWVEGSDGYPTLSGLPEDPHIKPVAARRVSIIGDSISSFKGWIPAGYYAHYPAEDGSLTLVSETYWYKLIYNYLTSADFEMNLSISGSKVVRSFPQRFIDCGGCGRPDVILIHGGTNDWSLCEDQLAPGIAIRNDKSNIYGGVAPDESTMSSIFTIADAAKSKAEVNALPDGTFCQAYTKLLRLIRMRYPDCKVVCIIGDYVGTSIEQSILLMAEHYGARTVNLLRVNGFNDLGGYSESDFSNVGRQPNMPKHDYSGTYYGCHPNAKAMTFIASKIYSELGSWLDN